MKVMSEILTENASEPDALSLITSFLSHLIIFIEAFTAKVIMIIYDGNKPLVLRL